MRRCALLTGSATGVGAAAALAFARRGYDVLLNYAKSEAEARETERACREAGADALVVQGDVAEDAACRRLVQAAMDRWKRLDVLVNNAGMSIFTGGDWDRLDAAAFQRIFAVNAIGPFQMIRAAAPHLKASRGAVVNVSSIAGALGIGSSPAYVASKGALNAMTLHLARALAPEVRVNAVCPGLITTRWFPRGVGEDAYQKLKAGYEAGAPLQTACTAEDVADAIVWLAEGARTVTGELLLLDAGVHLGTGVRVPPAKPG